MSVSPLKVGCKISMLPDRTTYMAEPIAGLGQHLILVSGDLAAMRAEPGDLHGGQVREHLRNAARVGRLREGPFDVHFGTHGTPKIRTRSF